MTNLQNLLFKTKSNIVRLQRKNRPELFDRIFQLEIMQSWIEDEINTFKS